MRARRSEESIALAAVMCPRCEARPGERCKTIGGAASPRVHSGRINPLLEAWRNGYADRMEDEAAR